MHKTTLFSRAGRLAVAVSGALALAGAALPANASTLRIAMTAADIPLTLGQPDQGYEGNRFTGIPLVRIEVFIYTICAALAGLAGMIHASQLYSAEPASGVGFELNAIAAVVVGGTSFTGGIGSMTGTLIGAVIIGILDKGLNQMGVHFSLQYIVKGLVILAAVYIDVRRRK